MTTTEEFINLKVLQMPCCGHLLYWINVRYPSYCPTCGELVYPEIKDPKFLILFKEEAKLVLE